ncbi:DUF5683 domain-containing protein [Cardinium endosymbiont of Philonthus spinipes]|uniref:DUF5683 domain-containing protein n=1 Tax=Cardinium endosymbiont of Philonthus spinipes TaxID=3077941 RepID=UPI00313ED90C
MRVCYKFFLMVAGWLYFPYLSQASILPHNFIVSDFSSKSPSILHATKNQSNHQAANQADEAALLYKTMRIQAKVQRSWLSSMVVPGLGQVYNKDYWKVPCLYLGFSFLGHRIYSEHREMHKHKRTLLMTGADKPNPTFTEKRIKECERTRDLFIIIASAWYLLNILDAYAGGHDKTVNFKDDIGTKEHVAVITKPALP